MSDVRNFKSKKEFVEQVEKYLLENKGHPKVVVRPHVTEILIGEEWKNADNPDFDGEEITVYCEEIHSENYTKSKKTLFYRRAMTKTYIKVTMISVCMLLITVQFLNKIVI
ncbi:hypothetical protein P4283_22865 [Bacillus thuringiensis]|nr:hypothetical protein [Bacillus thuringiensis]